MQLGPFQVLNIKEKERQIQWNGHKKNIWQEELANLNLIMFNLQLTNPHNESITFERSVINYWVGGGRGGSRWVGVGVEGLLVSSTGSQTLPSGSNVLKTVRLAWRSLTNPLIIASNKSFWLPVDVSKKCCVSGKQCRIWSDAAVCGVWSGSTLFAQAYVSPYSRWIG